MFKHFRLSAAPRGIIVCVIALSLCACATMTKSSSQVRVQQLETAQLAFIDNHTRTEGTPAPWDQASFDSEVAKITQQFTVADAKTQFEQLINEGKAASQVFIQSSAQQLEQWVIDVSNKKMTKDEFDNLVSSQTIVAKNFVASQALAAQEHAEKLTINALE